MRRILFSFAFCLTICATNSAFAWQTEPAAGKQVERSLTTQNGELPYLLYLPKDYDADVKKKWPLLLFLHGRGESHGPLALVTKWGPPKFAERGDVLPFILVSPQCPAKGFWSDEKRQADLDELYAHVISNYRIDQKKVCLTGLSMGGYGTWQWAADYPQRFCCLVPVCGGGNVEDADKVKSLPIWVFHGDQDRAVPFKKSVEMVDAIKKAGGTRVRFTSLEHVGHNCWSSAYAMPELYSWMLSQTSGQ